MPSTVLLPLMRRKVLRANGFSTTGTLHFWALLFWALRFWALRFWELRFGALLFWALLHFGHFFSLGLKLWSLLLCHRLSKFYFHLRVFGHYCKHHGA